MNKLPDTPIYFVVKKNVSILKNLYEWLEGFTKEGKSPIDHPLLFIDDECDYASVNTNPSNDKNYNPTKINQYIRLILSQFNRKTYVGYTATPYANIFIDRYDNNDKFGPNLFPDHFIYHLKPPKGLYMGAEQYFMDKDQDHFEELPLIEFIDDFRTKFRKLSPEEIAYPRSCNNLKKYSSRTMIYQKSTPIHVRGALLYNNLLKKKKLKKYERIQEGDKVKFVQLKEPNPLRENVISFIGALPKEFDLHQYIDYDNQFDKSFLEPLRFIVNAIGWSFERQSTLDSFF